MSTCFISPPFGNYINRDDCLSVKGTYTWERRRGLIPQTIKTLRPIEGGWRNSIGFRNKGFSNIKSYDEACVYSIAALDSNWEPFIHWIPKHIKLELNLGCPNVNNYTITDKEISAFTDKFPLLSVKLSPDTDMPTILNLYDLGVKTFHLSNTLPTDKGGVSGDRLREVNLRQVQRVARLRPHIGIIAGGGIYEPHHVDFYYNCGATAFSLSTAWFKPWKIERLIKKIKELDIE